MRMGLCVWTYYMRMGNVQAHKKKSQDAPHNSNQTPRGSVASVAVGQQDSEGANNLNHLKIESN